MTSSPVMGARGIADFAAQVTRNTQKTDLADFKSFMNHSQNKLDSLTNDKSIKTDKKVMKEDQPKEVTKDEKVQTTKNTSAVHKEYDDRPVTEDDLNKVENAIDEVKEEIKEAFDLSDEELDEVLEVLGLTQIALLDSESLPVIVSEITKVEDALSIATDENIFEGFTNVADKIEDAIKTLSDQIEVNGAELEEAVDKFKTVDAEITPVRDEAVLVKGESDEDAVEETDTEETFESKIFVVDKKTTGTAERLNVSETETANTSDIFKTAVNTDLKKSGNFEQHGSQNNAPMSFAENLMARVAESLAEETSEVTYTSFDAQNIMNQLTDYIKVDLSMDNPEVSMRLHPETLGTVSVKVSANNEGVLTAQFITQNESVKAVIESQALVLRESLESKGVTVEAVEVLVQSHEFERNLSDQNRGNEANGNNGSTKRTRRINLLNEEENIESEEDNLVREMMIQNGNTVDYSA